MKCGENRCSALPLPACPAPQCAVDVLPRDTRRRTRCAAGRSAGGLRRACHVDSGCGLGGDCCVAREGAQAAIRSWLRLGGHKHEDGLDGACPGRGGTRYRIRPHSTHSHRDDRRRCGRCRTELGSRRRRAIGADLPRWSGLPRERDQRWGGVTAQETVRMAWACRRCCGYPWLRRSAACSRVSSLTLSAARRGAAGPSRRSR